MSWSEIPGLGYIFSYEGPNLERYAFHGPVFVRESRIHDVPAGFLFDPQPVFCLLMVSREGLGHLEFQAAAVDPLTLAMAAGNKIPLMSILAAIFPSCWPHLAARVSRTDFGLDRLYRGVSLI